MRLSMTAKNRRDILGTSDAPDPDYLAPSFDAPNLHRVASSGRCSVNEWVSISKYDLWPLVRPDGHFRAAAYTDLMDTVLIPHALTGPFKDGLFSFQHDRSPLHTAASVKRLLEERCYSSENLWAAVEEEWQKRARSSVADSLYESLPRRMAAVLAARGELTKY
ncbi:hypothetical protein HPB52_019890 [Rhipicephalus sanguineus]|uniref:Transposase n=1 Tax=Rhipicephalus sanguineus TaxID=34632 RepID=A0A9D4PEX1_RHISA|nr:hypothetical protein HPB52_019890 [Rhipicephalus sanguineus]